MYFKTIKRETQKDIIPLSYLEIDDFDELNTLLKFDSVSKEEKEIREYVVERLTELNFNVSVDGYGNVLAVRGEAEEFGLFEAHMDKVKIRNSRSNHNNYNYKFNMESSLNINKIEYNLYKKESILESERLENIYKIKKDISEEEANAIWDKNKEEIKSFFGKEYSNFGFNCSNCINTCKSKTFSICHFFEVNDSVDSRKQFAAYKLSKSDKNKSDFNQEGIQESFDLSDKTVNLIGVKPKKKSNTENKYKVTIDLINDKITGKGKDRVLGGDDACGIFVILKVAEKLPNMPMKILFTVEEEIGCLGVKYFVENHADWLQDVKYSITIDRRGSNELLWSQKGVRSCSNDFAGKVMEQGVLADIPVSIEDGGSADVVYLRDYVPEAVNISAGYYNAHRKDEYIVPSELDKITGWVKNIAENI